MDDAGPPFGDDAETFGGGKYHDGSAAFPTLIGPNANQCPCPLEEACQSGGAKTAFIEGPLQCGGKGWYCRILPDPNWDGFELGSDLNAHHCNHTQSLDEAADTLHCHGSSDDSTYYWWVRDHWYRQYNGRLRCCCDWSGLTSSRAVTNRCDYRRVVAQGTTGSCRDANEEHGLNFETGCDAENFVRGQPIQEDDSQCWELQRFGHVDGSGQNIAIPTVIANDECSGPPTALPTAPTTTLPTTPTTTLPTAPTTSFPTDLEIPPTPVPSIKPSIMPSQKPSTTSPTEEETCTDEELFTYRGKELTCSDVRQKFCKKKLRDGSDNRVDDYCRESCDVGNEDEEPFDFRNRRNIRCDFWCNFRPVKGETGRVRDHCPESCGSCE